MTEPSYAVTGRGARIKHIVLDDEVLCPSEASTPATGAAASKPICSRCEATYTERQEAAAEEPQTEHKELALPTQIESARRMTDELNATAAALYDLKPLDTDARDQVLKTVGKIAAEAEATLADTSNLTAKGAAFLIEDLDAAQKIGNEYLTHQDSADADAPTEPNEDTDDEPEDEAPVEENAEDAPAEEPEVPASRNAEEVQIHLSARVTAFMAEELKGVHPYIATALAGPRLERCGRGFTAFVTLPRDHANLLLLQLKALLEDLNTGKRQKGTKGGMNFQPEAVAKGIQHVTGDLAT